jgi:hypothetical protein
MNDRSSFNIIDFKIQMNTSMKLSSIESPIIIKIKGIFSIKDCLNIFFIHKELINYDNI